MDDCGSVNSGCPPDAIIYTFESYCVKIFVGNIHAYNVEEEFSLF